MAEKELFGLDGAVAVVTGASGRLGPAMLEALAGAGAHVVAVARDRRRLQEAVEPLHSAGMSVEARVCDVSSPQWPILVDEVSHMHGRLDVLVNNAHVGRGGSLRTSSFGAFHEAHNLAVVAAWAGTEAAREGFAASVADGGSPSVVNVASMYGMVAPDLSVYPCEESRNPPFYGAAKAALLQLTRYLAAELGPLGIRANSIAPGPFPVADGQADPGVADALARRTLLNRVGRPEELKTALLFLASPHSAFVTGTNVVVDGGWTAR